MLPRYISAFLLLAFSISCRAEPIKILVSIKPLHSLISHITQGIVEPKILLQNQQSPHHFQLRPSQKRLINQSDVFFYSSDEFEGFITSLKSTHNNLIFYPLIKAPITTLPNRTTNEHHTDDEHAHDDEVDGHIWLSIHNAQKISQYVTKTLIKLDSENETQYKNNLKNLNLKLIQLRKSTQQLLKNKKDKAFLTYHDAFQYFEHENQLTSAFFVTTSSEHSPGIHRVKKLKQLIVKNNIQCVFYEPPNKPSLVSTLIENSTAKAYPLDPTGSQIPPGKNHYFKLMKQTASTLHNCLN